MLTMRRFLVSLVCVALSASLASAAESKQTADFNLQRVDPKGALVVLRTLANTRQIVVVDDHTVRVSDDESKIADVRAIVGLIEDPAEGSATVQLADGSTVAKASLRRAAAIDVLRAVREKLQIRKIATIGGDGSTSSLVLVRDSNEQAQEALKLIAEMDGGSGSGTGGSDNL